MLHLNRVLFFTDFFDCDISGETIAYGDYYYHDDERNINIKATVYHAMKQQIERDNFDHTAINCSHTRKDYKAKLQELERQFLMSETYEALLNEEEGEDRANRYR